MITILLNAASACISASHKDFLTLKSCIYNTIATDVQCEGVGRRTQQLLDLSVQPLMAEAASVSVRPAG